MDMTPELMARLTAGMREHYATVDYDKLPDLETAKKLTDAADRESEDYDETDEPADADLSDRVKKALAKGRQT